MNTNGFSTGHLIRNIISGPGWVSYFTDGGFYTGLKLTTTAEFYYFPLNRSLAFLISLFLLGILYYYRNELSLIAHSQGSRHQRASQ